MVFESERHPATGVMVDGPDRADGCPKRKFFLLLMLLLLFFVVLLFHYYFFKGAFLIIHLN